MAKSKDKKRYEAGWRILEKAASTEGKDALVAYKKMTSNRSEDMPPHILEDNTHEFRFRAENLKRAKQTARQLMKEADFDNAWAEICKINGLPKFWPDV